MGFKPRQRYWERRSNRRLRQQTIEVAGGTMEGKIGIPELLVILFIALLGAAGVRPKQARRSGKELGRSDSRFSVGNERSGRRCERAAGEKVRVTGRPWMENITL